MNVILSADNSGSEQLEKFYLLIYHVLLQWVSELTDFAFVYRFLMKKGYLPNVKGHSRVEKFTNTDKGNAFFVVEGYKYAVMIFGIFYTVDKQPLFENLEFIQRINLRFRL